jgi:hypothetical protein
VTLPPSSRILAHSASISWTILSALERIWSAAACIRVRFGHSHQWSIPSYVLTHSLPPGARTTSLTSSVSSATCAAV